MTTAPTFTSMCSRASPARPIQHKVYDGLDLGADLSVTFNPRNAKSDVGDTRIRIKVGTDDDGLG